MSDIGMFSPVFDSEIKRIIMEGERGGERSEPPPRISPVYTGRGRLYGLKVSVDRGYVNDVVRMVVSSDAVSTVFLYGILDRDPSILVFTVSCDRESDVWGLVDGIVSLPGVESVEVLKTSGDVGDILANPWMFPPRIGSEKLVMVPERVFDGLMSSVDAADLLAEGLLRVLGRERLAPQTVLRLVEVLGYCSIIAVGENGEIRVRVGGGLEKCRFCGRLIARLTDKKVRVEPGSCMIIIE